MGLFGGGNSTTRNYVATTNQDQRQAVQGGQAINAGGGTVMANRSQSTVKTKSAAQASGQGGNAVSVQSGGGDVILKMTPNAAFDLAQHSVDTLAQALDQTQLNAQGAASGISKQLVQIGIPAMVLIYWMGRKG